MTKAMFLPIFAGALLAAPAAASTRYVAALTDGQEIGPPPVRPTLADGTARPPSSGYAVFELNDDGTMFTFTIQVSGIDLTGSQTQDSNDNLTAAHIHAGAGVTALTNGGVVFGFIGMPFNAQQGDILVTPFQTGVGGTITGRWNAGQGNNTDLAAQLANLSNGRAYVNFHTVQFPGGELRGAIRPAAGQAEGK